MPAERKEIEEAKKEGIEFLFLTNMIKVLDGKIECVKTELIKKEGETREYPVNIEESNFFMDGGNLFGVGNDGRSLCLGWSRGCIGGGTAWHGDRLCGRHFDGCHNRNGIL